MKFNPVTGEYINLNEKSRSIGNALICVGVLHQWSSFKSGGLKTLRFVEADRVKKSSSLLSLFVSFSAFLHSSKMLLSKTLFAFREKSREKETPENGYQDSSPKLPRKGEGSIGSSDSRNITELPVEILIDILCRLPIETLLSCRCVCTTLRRTITSNPQFAHHYFSISPVHALLCIGTRVSRFLCLLRLEEETAADLHVQVPKLKFRLPIHNLVILNSHNGFLCLGHPPLYNPVIVCNPITGEYVHLPSRTDGLEDKENRNQVVSGFGYCPKTNQYKVVRLICRKNIMTEVYTLGEESWRSARHAPKGSRKWFSSGFYFKGVFLNGKVHWVSDEMQSSDFIITFDLETESFGVVRPPSHFASAEYGVKWRVIIGELGGCLFLIDHSSSFHLWIMKDYGVQESWTEVCDIGEYRPIMYLKDEKILVNYKNTKLACYDPRTNIAKNIRISGIPPYFTTVAHVPSFYSLKEIMKNAQSHIKVSRDWEGINSFAI
uniref:F-box domain-containing protein n=2 Tax=Manihot esculenta TaxID=3983 RepID=A0A2C9VVM8_MANES